MNSIIDLSHGRFTIVMRALQAFAEGLYEYDDRSSKEQIEGVSHNGARLDVLEQSFLRGKDP